MANIIGTILKGIGAGAIETGRSIGHGATTLDKIAGETLDSSAEKFADNMVSKNNVVGKVVGSAFEKVDASMRAGEKVQKNNAMQRFMGFKMKGTAAVGISGGLGLISIGDTAIQTHNESKIGPVIADNAANMLGFSHSPTTDATVEAMDNNPQFAADFERNNLPIDSYGAGGDLVFALHQLRQG